MFFWRRTWIFSEVYQSNCGPPGAAVRILFKLFFMSTFFKKMFYILTFCDQNITFIAYRSSLILLEATPNNASLLRPFSDSDCHMSPFLPFHCVQYVFGCAAQEQNQLLLGSSTLSLCGSSNRREPEISRLNGGETCNDCVPVFWSCLTPAYGPAVIFARKHRF